MIFPRPLLTPSRFSIQAPGPVDLVMFTSLTAASQAANYQTLLPVLLKASNSGPHSDDGCRELLVRSVDCRLLVKASILLIRRAFFSRFVSLFNDHLLRFLKFFVIC
jgi:hypothetical protein